METKFRKHKVPMGLLALLALAGVLLFLGAAVIGGAVAGGMMLGIGVISVAVLCWKMGQRGVYAEWEFQTPEVHPFDCRCPECLPERHPERCQCHECLPVEYPLGQTDESEAAESSATRDSKEFMAVNGHGRS